MKNVNIKGMMVSDISVVIDFEHYLEIREIWSVTLDKKIIKVKFILYLNNIYVCIVYRYFQNRRLLMINVVRYIQ